MTERWKIQPLSPRQIVNADEEAIAYAASEEHAVQIAVEHNRHIVHSLDDRSRGGFSSDAEFSNTLRLAVGVLRTGEGRLVNENAVRLFFDLFKTLYERCTEKQWSQAIHYLNTVQSE